MVQLALSLTGYFLHFYTSSNVSATAASFENFRSEFPTTRFTPKITYLHLILYREFSYISAGHSNAGELSLHVFSLPYGLTKELHFPWWSFNLWVSQSSMRYLTDSKKHLTDFLCNNIYSRQYSREERNIIGITPGKEDCRYTTKFIFPCRAVFDEYTSSGAIKDFTSCATVSKWSLRYP